MSFPLCWCPILRMDIYLLWAVGVVTTRTSCVSLYTCTLSMGTWRKTKISFKMQPHVSCYQIRCNPLQAQAFEESQLQQEQNWVVMRGCECLTRCKWSAKLVTRSTVKSRLDSRYDENIEALHAMLSISVLFEFLVVAPGVVVGLWNLQIEMAMPSQTLG